jgi:hypothetical protein
MNILIKIQIISLSITVGIYLLLGNYLKYEYHLTNISVIDTPIHKNGELLYEMKAIYGCNLERVFYANNIDTIYNYQPPKTYTRFTPAFVGLISSFVIFLVSILVPLLNNIQVSRNTNKMFNFGLVMLFIGIILSINLELISAEFISKTISKVPVERFVNKDNKHFWKLYYKIIVKYDNDWEMTYYADSIEKAIAFQPEKTIYPPNYNQIIIIICPVILGIFSLMFS